MAKMRLFSSDGKAGAQKPEITDIDRIVELVTAEIRKGLNK